MTQGLGPDGPPRGDAAMGIDAGVRNGNGNGNAVRAGVEEIALADAHLIETGLARVTRLEGGFLTVVRDDVRLPDGQVATREFVLHPGAVAIVPVLDDGRVVLVRQFRYPVGRILLELPAGKLDAGEPVQACAQRELREETGYTAKQWARAGVFHNAPAYSDEGIEIWFARGLVAGPQALDDGEFLEPLVIDADAWDAMAASGQISDMKTMLGLQWLQRWRVGHWPLEWVNPL